MIETPTGDDSGNRSIIFALHVEYRCTSLRAVVEWVSVFLAIHLHRTQVQVSRLGEASSSIG